MMDAMYNLNLCERDIDRLRAAAEANGWPIETQIVSTIQQGLTRHEKLAEEKRKRDREAYNLATVPSPGAG